MSKENSLIKYGIKDEERTACEVWTRVMGYHRPTSSYNPGKYQEHKDRLHFREELGTK